ncbi:heme NO-binding domain-containing protein [Heliophilum fasciatum]|uniref:Heme-NO-binding protein n=1 Tax=Heliophilum fasciatum TaxID=35700 RepID=A0A4R2R6V1_9FIRM|nr:heme NO-binding domain-containing protein [Heliophilum fasciatum]MCW2279492.1 hypothetical protein [Heliophilum fasciatum]TCP58800.1 heme-NO-binding protein [Heliophilum fasciatum]
MKGVIPICLKELVSQKFGQSKWEEIAQHSGVSLKILLPVQDVTDDDTMKIFQTTSKVLNLSQNKVIDMFGNYWATVYAPRMYRLYFTGSKNSKELLLKMDSIHVTMTQRMAGSTPPRFNYNWLNDKTLIMTYFSQRNLVDIAIACIKGIGEYYKETLQVSCNSSNEIKIVFP